MRGKNPQKHSKVRQEGSNMENTRAIVLSLLVFVGSVATSKNTCGDNEEFLKCGPLQSCLSTCQEIKPPGPCPAICNPGCFCKRGFFRDEVSGRCVRGDLCRCPPNEEYASCKSLCAQTCQNNQTQVCPEICIPGCNCQEGFLRDETTKRCVPKEECPGVGLPEETCGENEVPNECMNLCAKTCQSDQPEVCPAICLRGCDCIEGYLRDETSGKCVLEAECPAQSTTENSEVTCGENQYYSECGTACPRTCEVPDIYHTCSPECVPGCFCNEGYFIDESTGRCVAEDVCRCPRGSLYSSCGTACQPTCENPDPICTLECAEGCFCYEGYIRNGTSGECISKEKCPASATTQQSDEGSNEEVCGENQSWTDCGSACPETCQNQDDVDTACTTQCIAGCFCDDGFILDEATGKCVTRDECSSDEQNDESQTCGENQSWTDCGSACPETCQSQDDVDTACTQQCIAGCFCDDGFILDEATGKCVTRGECSSDEQNDESETCGENQSWTDCGSACPKTCEKQVEDTPCTEQCIIGCVCADGFVLDESTGNCISEDQCPNSETTDQTETCNENQSWNSCGTACPMTCENLNENTPCTEQCVSGCFCKEDYVLDGTSGKCIPRDQCPNEDSDEDSDSDSNGETCGENQTYDNCGTACPKTCQNPDEVTICTDQCVPGCYCNEGYLLDEASGRCVSEANCRCGLNSRYSSCGSSCESTCQNPEPRICPKICVEGCFCDEGYIRDEVSDLCVPKDSCTCGANSTFSTCASACPETCQKSAPTLCAAVCKFGCVCDEGFLPDEETGQCIPKESCDCGPSKVYSSCGSACPRTCQNSNPEDFCTLQCVVGCVCRDGFLVDEDTGECVPEELCSDEGDVTTLSNADYRK